MLKAVLPISVLVLLLPLEPMEPLVRGLGFELSHLELAAFVLLVTAAAALLFGGAGGVGEAGDAGGAFGRDVPILVPALLLLAGYALSAVFAENGALPWKFTLRVTAGVVAFALTSLALERARRFDLLFGAFAAAGFATAAVALLEASSPQSVESFVAPFREHSFEVGGRARVAATFSYPNTAAGFLVLALPPAIGFLLREKSATLTRALAFGGALAIFVAILLTYSRGAFLGAVAATALLYWLVRGAREEASRLLWLQATFVLAALGLFATEPSFRWRASTEGDRSWYLAEIEPEEAALALSPGSLSETGVTVRNVGKLTWGSAGKKPFHLSYRWFRASTNALEPIRIEGERTPLDSPLRPGGEAEIRARVRALTVPGTYVLIWDMVHEHTTWFSDKLGLGSPVRVVVGSGGGEEFRLTREIGEYLSASSWRPGRRELWGIALGLFRSHPLLGVGPDNFRWLYGEAAGRKVWDERVYSNSLYLELLATVGLVGFAAFVVLAGSALSGLLRRARGIDGLEAAVLAASLVGFVVHGVFDYLLAFTPIYLAFFILLGAGSAAVRGEDA